MEFKPTNRNGQIAGFSLSEMMVAIAIGLFIAVGALSFYTFSIASFSSMSNYTDMNQKNRYTTELISRDLRSTTSVSSYNSTNLGLFLSDGTTVTYTYNPTLTTLTRNDGTQARQLLTNLTSFSWTLYSRPTNYSVYYDFPPTTNILMAKLATFQWSCSRTVGGSHAADTASMQSAYIQMRNE